MTRPEPRPAPGRSRRGRHHPATPALAAALLAALLAAGCAGVTGQYIWVDDLPEQAAPEAGPYVISPGDLLSIRVYNQENLSGRVRVRSDGMISLPFLHDIQAGGLAPPVLAQRIQVRLKEFIVNPVVTVSLDEPKPLEVSVVGEVLRPGMYKLETGAGVLMALASAGGFNDFAARDRIFVLRAGGSMRIRFTYQALASAKGQAAGFRLRHGDVVVVE